MKVRFLPPELIRKGKPTGNGSRLESGRACERLDGFDSLSFRLLWVSSSVAARVPVKYQRVGSSPTRPSCLQIRRC